MEQYNPKNPDAFKQVELPTEEPIGLNIVAVTPSQSVLKEGDFVSQNYRKGRSGFRIRSDGSIEANNGTFTGTITATSGTIGGFNIGSDYIRDSANTFGFASTTTAGNDVRFWAGDTYDNRDNAPFRIYDNGIIVITDGRYIADFASNEILLFDSVLNAVNYIAVTNAATGNSPSLDARGDDANVDLFFSVQGNAGYNFRGTTSTQALLNFFEQTTNGTNFLQLRGPASISANYAVELPSSADTIVGRATTDTLTNKTISASSNVLGGVTMTLGSDADGDIYYRSSNVLTRLAKGAALQQLRMNSGATAPEWATISSSDVAMIPQPISPQNGVSTRVLNNNVDAYAYAFKLERGITVNKITFNVTAVGTSGTLKVGIFSEDGQTRHISITTATISATGLVTTAVSAVALSAGVYYIVILPVDTANITVSSWLDIGTISALDVVSSEPRLSGVLTVTASTMPSTFSTADSGTFQDSSNSNVVFRLDN